jgi:predicted RNA-binding protein with PUA domain
MKQLFYTLLILALIYFCYWYITRTPDFVKVSGNIRVLQENTPENFYNVSIHGIAENTGDITVKDVWIIYKVGDDEVSAYINELQPREKMNFRTGTSRTKSVKPEFELVSVEFNK